MKFITLMICWVAFYNKVKCQQREMLLNEFIQIVLNYHPVLKQGNLIVQMAEHNEQSARGSFDPKLISNVGG